MSIKVGTPCYVVRSDFYPQVIGDIVTVKSPPFEDELCGTVHEISRPAHAPHPGGDWVAPPSCLQPIIPPDETDEVRRDEEITA